MTALAFAIGLVAGALCGGAGAYFFLMKSKADATDMVETLSAKVVARQAEEILRLAESKLTGKKEVIDSTLKGMKDEMKDKMREVEEQMKSIGQGNMKVETRLNEAAKFMVELRDTTNNLKTALAGNSSRGQWGERMAEDVLRLSGMIEGINYIKQAKLEAGSKPDFTFLLPQNLRLNMDVKFPFNNYEQFAAATTDVEREEFKKKFLRDVRNRVKEIQTRDYINPEDQTVDYVLLFVPNEQIFGFINEIDRDLIDEAMKAKTILCSPLSLYAILSVIRQSIDNFRMENKSREMLALFGAFKDQWEKYKGQMETVRKQLNTVSTSYDELVGTRERQLERPLNKLDELRVDQGIETAHIQKTLGKVAGKMTEGAETTL